MKLNPHGKSYKCVEERVRDFLKWRKIALVYGSGEDIGGPIIINKVSVAVLKKVKKQIESEKFLTCFGKEVAVKLTYKIRKFPKILIPDSKTDLWVTNIDLTIA